MEKLYIEIGCFLIRGPYRSATVHMSSNEEASNLYDQLHGKVIHSLRLQTAFIMQLHPEEQKRRQQKNVEMKQKKMEFWMKKMEMREAQKQKKREEIEEKNRTKLKERENSQKQGLIGEKRKKLGLFEELRETQDWEKYFQSATRYQSKREKEKKRKTIKQEKVRAKQEV